MNNKIHHIKERFPEKTDDLALLIGENKEFLDLCEDYDICVNAFRYWVKSKKSEAKDRAIEYRSIARELEEEINQALNTLKKR